MWTSNPSHGSGETTFTIGTSVMPTHIEGWTLQPDARYPVFYTITAATSTTVSVAGDITGTLPDVTETDVFYMLIPPAGVDKATGALSQDALEPVTRYLAFQYHYQPPVAGYEPELFGRQEGNNLAGGYYCWHRRYDPTIGRWTTPDAVLRARSNLVEYCNSHSLALSDPTGLVAKDLRYKTEQAPVFIFDCVFVLHSIDWVPLVRSGWIVQEMKREYHVEACDGTSLGPMPKQHYWEAWKISNGQAHDPRSQPGDEGAARDYWWFSFPADGTRGWTKWEGWAKIVSAESLGEDPGTWSTHQFGLWGTTVKPKNWDRSNTTHRMLIMYWDCCPGSGFRRKRKWHTATAKGYILHSGWSYNRPGNPIVTNDIPEQRPDWEGRGPD